jgi:hypothetical protein
VINSSSKPLAHTLDNTDAIAVKMYMAAAADANVFDEAEFQHQDLHLDSLPANDLEGYLTDIQAYPKPYNNNLT